MVYRSLIILGTLSFVVNHGVHAQSRQVVTSVAHLTLSGRAVTDKGESVIVDGSVHVVTQVASTPDITTVTLHTNVPADIKVVSATTGARYRLLNVVPSKSDFTGLGSISDADISAVAFLVMLQAAEGAREDLKAILAINLRLRFYADKTLASASASPCAECF
jgi:hypothetical protein